MEIETLSNYEQNRDDRLDKNMSEDIKSNQEEESASSANEVYEERTESQEPQDTEINKDDKRETSAVDSESDEDCEEEEEKLLLSPVHSDEGDGEPLSPVDRDLLDSDCEGDKEESETTERDNNVEESTKLTTKENNDPDEEASDKVEEKRVTEEVETCERSEGGEESQPKLETTNLNEEVADTLVTERNESDIEEKSENSVETEGNANDVTEKEHDKVAKNGSDIIEEKEEADSNSKEKDDFIDTTNKPVIDVNSEESTTKDENKSTSVKEDDASSQAVEETVENNEMCVDNEKTIPKQDEVSEESSKNDDKSDEIVSAIKDKDCNSETEKVEENANKAETVQSEENLAKSSDATNEVSSEVRDTKTPPNDDKKQAKKDDKCDKKDRKENEKKEENSILKEMMMKPIIEEKPEPDEDIDMDDFDPSLLMPELSMEVDEAPVITNTDIPEGNKSPMRLYDPIFSTFVDEMTGAEVDFDLTAEELELKARTFGPNNPVQATKIHCTACNIHLGSALDGQGNRFVHPLLKVLICKKCYHFYTSGEFEKDEDGSELYCRWCGQGGQVMCCSDCEMVFCKKCIRINFDRKKLAEIQKSEDWRCFRCNQSQLIHLRIHCAEFMEYVQREIRNVGSSNNPEAFMNTDYCQCCLPQKKKAPETTAPVAPKKKKRVLEVEDPDYNPMKDRDSPSPPPATAPTAPSNSTQPQLNKIPVVSTRPTVPNMNVPSRPPLVRQVIPVQNKSRVQVVNPTAARPQAGYIRVPPGAVRPTAPTITNPAVSVRPATIRPIRPAVSAKNEWFEKTVRAAARVNSNLSYTLTQLNRAQANATSVEALAVVHNKLQEILSSSINSLIQIRKNLRTEFIAGIKNIRFPPKGPTPTSTLSTSSKDDDDVIFIPSDPSPAPVTQTVPVSVKQLQYSLPPEISITKKESTQSSSSTSNVSKPGPSGIAKTVIAPNKTSNDNAQPKGFLRVKSFSALQNVSAECITIPDDPPEDQDVMPVIENDPLAIVDVPGMKEKENSEEQKKSGEKEGSEEKENSEKNGMANGDKNDENGVKRPRDHDESEDASMDSVKRAKILIERSTTIDELVKNKYGQVNGNNSDVEVD